MRDADAPPRRSGVDSAEAGPDEAKVRQALERLGTRSSPAHGAASGRASGAAAAGARTAPRPRPRFVRDGDVPVVRVPARQPGDAGHELAEERAARQRAEETLAAAQGTIGRLQVARSRAEQALQAAQAAVEERDALIAGLRADLVRAARQRDEAQAEAARAKADKLQAEAMPAPAGEPEPVRWWLDYSRPSRS